MRRIAGILGLTLAALVAAILAVWWTSERAAAQSLHDCLQRIPNFDCFDGECGPAASMEARCLAIYAHQRDFLSWLLY